MEAHAMRAGVGIFISTIPMPYTTPYILKMSEVHVADPSTDPEEVQAMDTASTAGESPEDQKDQTNNDTGGKGYP